MEWGRSGLNETYVKHSQHACTEEGLCSEVPMSSSRPHPESPPMAGLPQHVGLLRGHGKLANHSEKLLVTMRPVVWHSTDRCFLTRPGPGGSEHRQEEWLLPGQSWEPWLPKQARLTGPLSPAREDTRWQVPQRRSSSGGRARQGDGRADTQRGQQGRGT